MPIDPKEFMERVNTVVVTEAYRYIVDQVGSWLSLVIDAIPGMPSFGTVETTLGETVFCEVTATWKQGNKMLRLYFRPNDIGYRFVIGNTSDTGVFPYTDFEDARLIFEAFQKEA